MKTSFPWQALKVICDGVSILDITKLEIQSESEAHQFLLNYGYDLYEPSHVEQLWSFYDEALKFLSKTVELSIPAALKDRDTVTDIRRLLLVASGNANFPQSKYKTLVCAILRVMHVLSLVKNDLRLKYISKIRKQTIGRFDAHIQATPDEKIFLGFEKDKIPLVKFEKKEGKNRSRVVMKLLQKSQSVAQEIYDHLGVRFVTRNRGEALLVVKYLLDHHLISVANIISARCRNTLISVDEFRKTFEAENTGDAAFYSKIEKDLRYPSGTFKEDNPFSSSDYHALQFTCRPLIRIPVVRKGGIRAEISFFFPMEVQILDETSYVKSQAGDAKHSAYKQKQLEAVRSRVLRAAES